MIGTPLQTDLSLNPSVVHIPARSFTAFKLAYCTPQQIVDSSRVVLLGETPALLAKQRSSDSHKAIRYLFGTFRSVKHSRVVETIASETQNALAGRTTLGTTGPREGRPGLPSVPEAGEKASPSTFFTPTALTGWTTDLASINEAEGGRFPLVTGAQADPEVQAYLGDEEEAPSRTNLTLNPSTSSEVTVPPSRRAPLLASTSMTLLASPFPSSATSSSSNDDESHSNQPLPDIPGTLPSLRCQTHEPVDTDDGFLAYHRKHRGLRLMAKAALRTRLNIKSEAQSYWTHTPNSAGLADYKSGEILGIQKMLVMVKATLKKSFSGPFTDAEDCETRVIERWKEYIFVVRSCGLNDRPLLVQFYKNRGINHTDTSLQENSLDFALTSHCTVGVYSNLDRSLSITVPQPEGLCIYLLQCRNQALAAKWLGFLRCALGEVSDETLKIHVPALQMTLDIRIPPETYDVLRKAEQQPQVSLMITRGKALPESPLLSFVIDSCLSQLRGCNEIFHEWERQNARLALVLRERDRLAWFDSQLHNFVYARWLAREGFYLELRPITHYPHTVEMAALVSALPDCVSLRTDNPCTGTASMVPTLNLIVLPYLTDTKRFPALLRRVTIPPFTERASPLPATTLISSTTPTIPLMEEPEKIEGYLGVLTNRTGRTVRLMTGTPGFHLYYFCTCQNLLFKVKNHRALPPLPGPTLTRRETSILGSKDLGTGSSVNGGVYDHCVYRLDTNGELDFLKPHTSVETFRERDACALYEAERKVRNIVEAQEVIDICDILRIEAVEEVDRIVMLQCRVVWGGEPSFFDLHMRNGCRIRLQTCTLYLRDEWMGRLTTMMTYWKARKAADLALISVGRQRTLEQLGMREYDLSRVPELPWERVKHIANAEIYNVSALALTNAICMSGVLFQKPKKHANFKKYFVVLVPGKLILFFYYTRSMGGSAKPTSGHSHFLTIPLAECYLYSGLTTAMDLLQRRTASDLTQTDYQGLLRLYSDGWRSAEPEASRSFTLWFGKKRAISGKQVATTIGEERGRKATPKNPGLVKIVSRLGVTGKSMVFMARSVQEKDLWVTRVAHEIERCNPENGTEIRGLYV